MPAVSVLGLAAMLQDGYFLPEGGMGRIPEVLADAVRAKGGYIHLNSPVGRILVNKGVVYAVDVDGQGAIEIDAVISCISAMHTYGSLLSACDVPTSMLRKTRRAQLSARGFVLQLGLAGKIETCSHINCVAPWLYEQSQVFRASDNELRWLTYTVPTVTLPELAPAGCSIVEMFPPINQEIAPDDWSEARKENVTAQAVEWLSRNYNIDISQSRVLSPKEFQDDAHLYAGALYGISPVAGPAALFKHRTPIHGLYQAGQTTWPGFGVVGAGMSGVFAAESLRRDKLS
jgi:phytoene dehydrogenase-like protein